MDSIKVSKYMDRQPVLLAEDMPLSNAVDALLERKKLGAPVVDDLGQLVGFLSQQDCLSVMLKSSYHCDLVAKVKDCMRSEVLSVTPDTSVLQLAEQMLGPKPKVYPVVDNGKVIGTINRTNVLNAINIHMQQCYLAPV
ncbi:CBS domain-containing protein [Shewanella violacea]|uniref:CBS domain protein n=1 Tax=Shewanella violacea (strain JCM 10179 / CIP 106290 / LMG 19151 / DSS12) TaxID=637905 RepID=D4ZL75_SHEVD|nr:CBS domain-containing protein [Shewanella violacea]BAJ02424.1 CBS domain protein [Shewanella violacea DSS12]